MIKKFDKKTQLKYIKQAERDKNNYAKECHILWREICFLKANGICEYPGCCNKSTQPHHINTKGAYPHLKYDPDNSMGLCYPHHKGGKHGAHCDINFKEVIVNGGVRTKEFFDKLERKADSKYKLDLKMEFIYLTKLRNELLIKPYEPR